MEYHKAKLSELTSFQRELVRDFVAYGLDQRTGVHSIQLFSTGGYAVFFG